MESPANDQISNNTIMQGYKRPDGEVGIGFEIEFAGVKQHSVVWANSPAQRFRDEDLAQYKIDFGPLQSFHTPAENTVSLGFHLPDGGSCVRLVTVPMEAFSESDDSKGATETIPETVPTGAGGESTDSEKTPENTGKTNPETVPGVRQSIVHGSDDEPTSPLFDPDATPQNNIMAFVMANTEATDADVIRAMHESGLEVSTGDVKAARQQIADING